MTGTQGNKWINARVNIVRTEAYQLVFEALRGTDYRGDIAIDDVKVTYTPCAASKGEFERLNLAGGFLNHLLVK